MIIKGDRRLGFDPEFFSHLEFGKLYVCAATEQQAEGYRHILHSGVHNRSSMWWMSGFEIAPKIVPMVNTLGLVIAARKVNVGNIGRYSVLACLIQNLDRLDDALQVFYERLSSMEPDADDEDGTFTLLFPEESSAIELSAMPRSHFPEAHPFQCLEVGSAPMEENIINCEDSFAEICEDGDAAIDFLNEDSLFEDSEIVVPNFCDDTDRKGAAIDIFADEDAQEEAYANSLLQQRDHDLQLIQGLVMDFIRKYHTDPSNMIAAMLKGKYVVNSMPLLVVNRNREIVFPEYNESELRLSAASRTLYIWFLKHPEGCRLKDLCCYREELLTIYEEVAPGHNFLEEKVDALLDAGKINQNLSRIKKCVRCIIVNDDIAHHYYISGERNGIYTLPIAADTTKVRLPQPQIR
ncbi:MAG: hypothetical protein ACI30R_03365 [Sodaliphilus sp.]